jgi:hypothetical protein
MVERENTVELGGKSQRLDITLLVMTMAMG